MCNVRICVREFRQRLIDCYLQEWNSGITCKDRYAFFSSFKQTHGLSQYLFTVKNLVLKRLIVSWCVLRETASVAVFFQKRQKETLTVPSAKIIIYVRIGTTFLADIPKIFGVERNVHTCEVL